MQEMQTFDAVAEAESRRRAAQRFRMRLGVAVSIALLGAGFTGLLVAGQSGGGIRQTLWLLLLGAGAAGLTALGIRAGLNRQRMEADGAGQADDDAASEPASRRRRPGARGAVEQAARRLDLSYVAKAAREERVRLANLAMLPKPTEVRHVMRGEIRGRALTAFQHTYIVPAGQVMIPVLSTVYLAQAPAAWPKVTIAPTSLWRRAAARLRRRRGPTLDLDAFNRAFAVETKHPDFAILLLTPEMQELLLDKRRQIKWVVGEGAIRLIYPGKIHPGRMERSIERLGRFLDLLPDALEAWREDDGRRSMDARSA